VGILKAGIRVWLGVPVGKTLCEFLEYLQSWAELADVVAKNWSARIALSTTGA
jgi:hypothetical protein